MVIFQNKIIGLITDFGTFGSHYVASMKGVIFKINPKVKIIDISHSVKSFSILEASYVLKSVIPFFPEGTIFILVVDPGVGTSRDILAMKTENNHFFVGPNNGIFGNAIDIEIVSLCIKVENNDFFNKPVSNTFHGRDIMAPIAAHISLGLDLKTLGTEFDKKILVKTLKYDVSISTNKIQCIIQYIDNFGNGITNLKILNNVIESSNIAINYGEEISIEHENNNFKGKYYSSYGNVSKGSLLFIKGSTGYLEISINQGNASKYIGFKVGDIITINL
jgi:S-adenosylmethionine hydrolase